jgi:hypothetical protein
MELFSKWKAAIEACPPIAEGAGEVVTGRYITRQVDEIANVTLATGDQLSGTPIHPVWVINQQAFFPLGKLTVWDLLDTNRGPVAVAEVEIVYRPQPVYNLEINAEHVYRVGELGVLVHNSNVPGDCTPLVEITIPPRLDAAHNAFETAKAGGRHAGFLANYSGKTAEQLQKGIESLQKQIAEHADKIANPGKYIPNFGQLDSRQQAALLGSKWPSDIARQQEQVQILEGLLKLL